MQNLQLSNNVKKYFVNALKGLGLRSKNSPEELSSMTIANLLDNPNTTPFDIYYQIRLAVLQRLRNDAFTTKALQKDTAFNRNTVKLVLNNLNVDPQLATNIQNNSDELLRDLSASGVQENGNITSSTVSHRGHVDEVVENVIVTLMAGVPEQNLNSDDSNHDEKQQAVDLWNEIRYAMFKRRLITTGHYDENKFNAWIKTGEYNEEYARLHQKFHVGRIRSDLIAEVKTRFLGGGTDSEAEAFLNTKIQGNELKQILEANGVLLKDCKLYCQRRCQAEQVQYDENQLTLFDVLAAAGSAKKQIITFFQERSQEQKQDQIQNPSTTEVKKENKIGNVMGNAGRAFVKEATGIGTNVDFDEIGLKDGRKGPWRGYKSLFESILRFIGDFYGKIPTIGFVQNLMARELGYSFAPESARKNDKSDETEDKQPWETGFKEMPKEYYNEDGTFNLAGKFYNKTKARLLNDRMSLVEITQKYEKTKNEAEKLEIQKNIAYLQIRIVMADEILKNKMPDPTSSDFNNPDYYADLERKIIAEEENEDSNEYIKANIKDDKVKNANDYMVQSLDRLRNMSEEPSPDAVKSKREMAKVMFNLENKCQIGEVSDKDLDGMVERFYNSDKYRRMRYMLNNPTEVSVDDDEHIIDEFELNAVDAMLCVNQLVEKDLKENAIKSEYDQYQYRDQIYKATVKEMNDGGMTM